MKTLVKLGLIISVILSMAGVASAQSPGYNSSKYQITQPKGNNGGYYGPYNHYYYSSPSIYGYNPVNNRYYYQYPGGYQYYNGSRTNNTYIRCQPTYGRFQNPC